MAFPQTRLTLIQRLAAGGTQEDWHCFWTEYWGPVCRFALRFGATSMPDAEEVASQTFEVLLANQLLTRWASNRSAKLRSILCSVVRNVLANRHRVQQGRQRLMPEVEEHLRRLNEERSESADDFYAAWVEDLLQRAIEALAAECYAKGKGDYVRVIYSRICQRRSTAEVAQALDVSSRTVENYYSAARERLGQKLTDLVRCQVRHHCSPEEEEAEFAQEWRQLGQYLVDQGGLEAAIQRTYQLFDPVKDRRQTSAAIRSVVERLTSIRESSANGQTANEDPRQPGGDR